MSNVVSMQDYRKMPAPIVADLSFVEKMELRSAARAAARALIIDQYPNLARGSDCVVAAKNIRAELKAAFPAIKFSVKSSKYSGGNSIRIEYQDGPKADLVREIVGKYKLGNFDGMVDMYEFNCSAFNEEFGGAYYVSPDRNYSDAAVALAIEAVSSQYKSNVAYKYNGVEVVPSVELFRKGELFNVYPSAQCAGDDYQVAVNYKLSQMSF